MRIPCPPQVTELPTMVGYALFRRLTGGDDGQVTKDAVVKFWLQRNLHTAPLVRRVYDSLRQDGQEVSARSSGCYLHA